MGWGGGEGGRERESLQSDQSALSAAEGWTDERRGDTDRGTERVGEVCETETPSSSSLSSLSLLTVVQMGETLHS